MNLAEFARWAVENGPFEGCDLDGGDVQEKAVACGIIVQTTYNPAKHGPCHECDPGDPYYEYSQDFSAELRRAATGSPK